MPRRRRQIGTDADTGQRHGWEESRMDVRASVTVPHAEFFPPPRVPRGKSGWLRKLNADHRELARFWPVIANMAVQELRVRYQRSILGFFWTLLNPLLMMMVLTPVFSSLNRDLKSYPLFLFAGMVPWSFLSVAINECAVCIIQNEGLIRKIYLPKLVFPLSRALIGLVTFVLSLSALFLLLLPLGARPASPMFLLPLAIALLAAFALGIGLIVATANTFYRDCGHLVNVFLQAWYFATPILFPLEAFPESIQWRFRLNPAYYFIELFHAVLYRGEWPRLGLVTAAAVIAAMSLGIGYAIFKSQEDKMVFRL
jgi:ABC-2 type transport system permease protein/lipopolysaccharide transport system permease protein